VNRGAYSRAGVDLVKVKEIHDFIAAALKSTFKARNRRWGKPILEPGHYAGVIDIGGDLALTLHVDGVGTKLLVAQSLKKYDTIGIDCVAMTVNDLLCLGSEPVALLDYMALQSEDDELVQEIMKGLVEGARRASVAIIGGETAILRGMIDGIGGRGFDLAAMGIGVVRKDKLIDGSKITEGDRVIGIKSSGLHSNGYTLARKVLVANHALDEYIPKLGRNLGEELLIPTSIYVDAVLDVINKCRVHGLAHITGGAFKKLTRLVKDSRLSFRLTKSPSLPIFDLIKKEGKISDKDMYNTFNMGVGFCIISPPSEVEKVLKKCSNYGMEAFEFGTVEKGEGVYIEKLRIA
jgi:phosphoribosylformylglycinamidine cyclo-ligase